MSCILPIRAAQSIHGVIPMDAENKSFPHEGLSLAQGQGHTVLCLSVIGQIEGHYALASDNKTTKYEHMIPQLFEAEMSDSVDGVLFVLNTVGGDIEAGLALAELIAGMSKPTVTLVLGGGHSIGVPLAVAANYSLIAPTATMTLHPVRTNGLVLGVPQAFTYFERMQTRISGFVENHSAMSAARFCELCMNTGELVTDMGSVLDGEMAVREGLIQQVGSLADAVRELYRLIDEKRQIQQ